MAYSAWLCLCLCIYTFSHQKLETTKHSISSSVECVEMNASSSVFRLPFTLLLLLLLWLPGRASFSFTIAVSICNQFNRLWPIKIACGLSDGVHYIGHSPLRMTLRSKECKKQILHLHGEPPIGCSIYAAKKSRDPKKNPTFRITDGQSNRHAGMGQQGFPAHSGYAHGNANGFAAGHGQNHEDNEQLPSYEDANQNSPYDQGLPSYNPAVNSQQHHDDLPPTYEQAMNGHPNYDEGNQHLPPLQHEYILTLNEYGVNFRIPGQHDFFEPYQWPIKYVVYIHNNFHNLLLTVSCKIDRHIVRQTIYPRGRPMSLPLNMPPDTKKAVGCTCYWDKRKNRNAKKYYSFFAFDTTTKVHGPIYYIPGQYIGLLTWHLQDDGIYLWSAAHGRSEKVSLWREQKSRFSRYSYKKRTKKPIKFRKKKTYRSSRWNGAGQVNPGQYSSHYQRKNQGQYSSYDKGNDQEYQSHYQGNNQGEPTHYKGNSQGYTSHYPGNIPRHQSHYQPIYGMQP